MDIGMYETQRPQRIYLYSKPQEGYTPCWSCPSALLTPQPACNALWTISSPPYTTNTPGTSKIIWMTAPLWQEKVKMTYTVKSSLNSSKSLEKTTCSSDLPNASLKKMKSTSLASTWIATGSLLTPVNLQEYAIGPTPLKMLKRLGKSSGSSDISNLSSQTSPVLPDPSQTY